METDILVLAVDDIEFNLDTHRRYTMSERSGFRIIFY